ncbi:MAG: UDP-4-amino-4,6-dideoxy-N-acetyl-beta-L-altrosamine transaminase [Ignavibacteria bacterium]
MIPYGRQWIDEEDKAAVLAVLESDWLTQGPAVPRFERSVAQFCGAVHGVAVANGTAALHLACLALDVGPGDRVWTSPITFVASANCARYCGAQVDFIDIDPETVNLSPTRLADRLVQARRDGCLPKVVIPVHFAGRCCDMDAIGALSEEFGFSVIEDASHALGAKDAEAMVGACRRSAFAVTSFHPVKLVTTGEGGMLLTRDDRLAERCALLRSHGITRDPSAMTGAPDGPWYYQQVELGYNYRMTDIQAALGASQMTRLPGFLTRRRELVRRYRAALAHLPISLPRPDADEASAWHLFVVRVAAERRRQVFEALREAGIGVNVHYIPVHLQLDYARLGFRAGQFPAAEQYYREAITLPLYPAMTDAQQDEVAASLERALNAAS